MSTSKSQHELISGMLDSQLSADEQELVDRLLQTDEEAQALHQELDHSRRMLQGVPSVKLDADFHQRVMAAAEEALLEERGAAYGLPAVEKKASEKKTSTSAGDAKALPSWVGRWWQSRLPLSWRSAYLS